jgi:hypothetical protein
VSASERYNGWANRATWCVALWLGNEEGLYHDATAIARRKTKHAVERDDAMREYVEELCGEPLTSGFVGDLLGIALAQVDWREVVESFREKARS